MARRERAISGAETFGRNRAHVYATDPDAAREFRDELAHAYPGDPELAATAFAAFTRAREEAHAKTT